MLQQATYNSILIHHIDCNLTKYFYIQNIILSYFANISKMNENLNELMVERLRKLIQWSGLQQKEIANILGIKVPTFSSYLTGKAEISRLFTTLHLNLGVNIGWLITGLGEPLIEFQQQNDLRKIYYSMERLKEPILIEFETKLGNYLNIEYPTVDEMAIQTEAEVYLTLGKLEVTNAAKRFYSKIEEIIKETEYNELEYENQRFIHLKNSLNLVPEYDLIAKNIKEYKTYEGKSKKTWLNIPDNKNNLDLEIIELLKNPPPDNF